MNALLFTNLFPSGTDPTRGLFNLHRFGALAKHCPVRVVAPVSAWRRMHHPGELIEVPSGVMGGLDVSYPTSWTVPRLKPEWHSAAMYQSVRSHVQSIRKQFPFDAVIGAFAYPDAVVAAQLAADVKCPFIALVMGSDMNVLATKPALRGLIRDALLRADTVVALSTALKERVTELGVPSERVVVQRNGVDGARFVIRDKRESRRLLGLDVNQPVVIFVGNVVDEKGADVLVDAIGRGGAGLKELRVVFVGDGKLRDELTSKVDRLGMGARIHFVGKQAPEKIPIWMGAADVLCLPSRREGCPNVVLEALACGRPVVGSRVGGVPELLNADNGIMVPPEDPSALAQGLAVALERSWEPVTLRGSVPSLSWDDFGERVHTLLLRAQERTT